MFQYVLLVFLIATMITCFPNITRFIASVAMFISFAIALMHIVMHIVG